MAGERGGARLGRPGLWPSHVELSSKTSRDVLAVELGSNLRLQVAVIERVEEVEGEHRHEPEGQDGVGAVFVDVIGVPTIDGFVESKILDVPAACPRAVMAW